MREGIVSAFQQVLSEDPGWRADVEGLHFKCLSSNEAESLEVQFTEEEIYAALMGMNGDKAPGPDGFTIAFWQSSWELVKEEIMELFREFYNQCSFANSLNSTFIVLIPKKGGAEDLGDFRPISLVGSLYKLLAKVLANRLKKVLNKVVSGDQNAFVRGKQILDASLMANEVIDFWHKRKEKGLICKLDIEKAYDSINWKFLMKVLVKMGFGSRWLDWIWWCISTAKFSVMINGVPTGFFSNFKGLRQGDPLSPYLFVLGMEVLSILIRRAVDGGFLSGCKIKGRGEEEMIVSHMLFADDTIIFCEANKEQVSALSWILAWFEAASGLRINLDKSVLIPVEECGWKTKEGRGTYGVGVWKEIMKEAKWCWENTKFKLYEMAVNKNATVNEMWDHSSGPGGWNLRFHRDFNDWELDLIRGLLIMLRDFKLSSEEDGVLWKRGGHGKYGVKEAYNGLVVTNACDFPYKSVW
ncbi:LINE-1 reverse transcriptase-like [Vitis vinifera]|uniref:LINE-1 reverse transcriptase-like n=1 Tax=Vitis vinifera TaxID=29760 RepID=A0A438F1L1_VITVI|nr:LINE-1 reverse transcriptase-like [Vitis vinifera]